jgi:hypothetical protein
MKAISSIRRRDFRNFRPLIATFIMLIPKKEDTVQAKDYRSISLIHSFMRLIIKILANKLVNRLDNMVFNN